jgi:hypothetical protein
LTCGRVDLSHLIKIERRLATGKKCGGGGRLRAAAPGGGLTGQLTGDGQRGLPATNRDEKLPK